jgi:hypothetical protein
MSLERQCNLHTMAADAARLGGEPAKVRAWVCGCVSVVSLLKCVCGCVGASRW